MVTILGLYPAAIFVQLKRLFAPPPHWRERTHCKIKHRKKIPKIVQEKLPPNFRKRILNLRKKNSELSEKNSELSEKNSELSEKNSELLEKNSELSEKNSELSEWNSELTEKKCKVWVAIFLA